MWDWRGPGGGSNKDSPALRGVQGWPDRVGWTNRGHGEGAEGGGSEGTAGLEEVLDVPALVHEAPPEVVRQDVPRGAPDAGLPTPLGRRRLWHNTVHKTLTLTPTFTDRQPVANMCVTFFFPGVAYGS